MYFKLCIARRSGPSCRPQARAAEMANYAMDCLEKENRIRQEIEGGQTTLGKVADLLRWDKKSG